MVNEFILLLSMLVVIFVGLFLGVIYSFLLRKISARLQWRVGPLMSVYSDLRPLLGTTRVLQPLYDVMKLFGKETIVPEVSRRRLFLYSPYISLTFAVLAVLFIPFPGAPLLSSTPYSLILASYLLIGAALFSVLGPVASGSPWAAVGVRREAELFLVSELGFVLSIFSVAIARGSLTIWEIANSPPRPILTAVAGALMLAAMLGKLHIKPFDMPEAEAEIVAGPYTEYSGRLLGTYYLARIFILYGLMALFVSLLLPPLSTSIIWLPAYLVSTLVLVFLLALIQVLNPRYRIGNALIWYVKILIPLSILNIVVLVV
jgi:NADH-quinone oxidoreductase subunit H